MISLPRKHTAIFAVAFFIYVKIKIKLFVRLLLLFNLTKSVISNKELEYDWRGR